MAVIRFRQVHFTPDDDVKGLLDGLPGQASKSIDVEIYGLTDLILVSAIIARAHKGVTVRVMNDRSQAGGPADKRALQTLVDAGLPNIQVKIVESERGAIDHLKVILLDAVDGPLADSSSVGYGSYNFSDGAQRQDNVFVWTNDPGEVAQTLAKFNRDWKFNKQNPEWQIQSIGGS